MWAVGMGCSEEVGVMEISLEAIPAGVNAHTHTHTHPAPHPVHDLHQDDRGLGGFKPG